MKIVKRREEEEEEEEEEERALNSYSFQYQIR
jgi:hypothetical protein